MTGFLAQNWLLLAALAAMFIMHRRGYGCGMHGHHGQHHHEHDDRTATAPPQDTVEPAVPNQEEKAGLR